MPPVPHTCLLIGDTTGLPSVEALLRTVFPHPNLRCIDRLSPVHVTDLPAGLIVACQTWSDEYTAGDVAAILSAAPLARVLCAYGRWCDSDGRTRDIWPLAVRVPVSEFEARLQRELRVLQGTAAPLPLTASRAEIFAARLTPAVNPRGGRSRSHSSPGEGP